MKPIRKLNKFAENIGRGMLKDKVRKIALEKRIEKKFRR